MIRALASIIKRNPKVKKIVHRLLVPKDQARPRGWVRWFVNPFVHKHGKGSTIRKHCRLDVLPFNMFSLGQGTLIEDFSVINNGVGDVIIGNNTLVGIGNVVIGPVVIGSDVILAQHVVLSGLNHGYTEIDLPVSKQKVNTSPIVVGDECWIAANVVITAGVTIGQHSIIGAGSVVTRDVPAYSVAAGNPARVIKKYNFETEEWLEIK